ncbi:MAG: LCP family protein [Acutalibacter sp.]|nr:LCP family protein [Acutalibacter sp.]
MSERNTGRAPAGRHGPPRRTGSRGSRPPQRRREPLRDNYYYEEPPRSRGGRAVPQSFEDISSYSSPGRRRADQLAARRPRRKPGGGKRAFKTVLLLFALLVLAGGLYVFGYMLSGLTMTSLTKDKDALGIAPGTFTDSSIKNIALFGLDAREDENTGRSDALMVLSVDSKHHKLKLTSILRDSQVYIDGYGYDKITHAYAYGGPELAVRTLNQNYHLDIENYVTVNFVEMAKIVDAFGGVRLTVSEAERVEINNNLYYLSVESADADIQNSDYLNETGELLLNGKQAVSYARIRHLEGGDDMRAGRQQIVLQALIQQLKGKSKLAYPALVHNVVPMCETSLGYLDMMGLAPFLLTDFTMETLTVPGQEENAYGDFNENGAWVYLYDIEAAAAHISRFIYE